MLPNVSRAGRLVQAGKLRIRTAPVTSASCRSRPLDSGATGAQLARTRGASDLAEPWRDNLNSDVSSHPGEQFGSCPKLSLALRLGLVFCGDIERTDYLIHQAPQGSARSQALDERARQALRLSTD